MQNIAIGFVFFSLFRYFGNSLKLATSGLTDLLKVPTLYSNGFLESKTNVFLSLINLFHFLEKRICNETWPKKSNGY